MNEPKITPLARRLAEENSIDWRQLPGTGPEGTVVERDILGFLAKVMSGEVTLPPAPEEVPQAGHEAIANFAQAQAALQREGVQLGDLMPSMAQPAAASTEDSLLDDLDFDIDLDLDDAAIAASEEPMAAPVLEVPTPAPSFTWESAEAPSAPKLPDLDLPTPVAPNLPDLDVPTPSTAPSPALVWETQEVMATVPPPQPSPMPMPVDLEPEPMLDVSEPVLDVDTSEPVFPSFDPQPEPIQANFDAPIQLGEVAIPEPIAPEPIPEPTPAPEPMVPPVAPVMGAIAGLGMASAAAPVEPPEPVTPPTAPPSEVQSHAPAALKATKVQAWQRIVEVRAAQEAAHTLSDAWRMSVGLYPLLYRAVDRALADTQTPLRATKGVLEGEELHSHRVSASQSLRGVLDSLQMASDASEGLAVLSLADTTFDQVIFPGMDTVILGRVKDDYATLSVSGNMDARQAGTLLERISYYLERPILLV